MLERFALTHLPNDPVIMKLLLTLAHKNSADPHRLDSGIMKRHITGITALLMALTSGLLQSGQVNAAE